MPGHRPGADNRSSAHPVNHLDSGEADHQPKRGTGDAESQVKERGIRAHNHAALLRRSRPHGFHSEAGIDQRVAEAGQGRADKGQNG